MRDRARGESDLERHATTCIAMVLYRAREEHRTRLVASFANRVLMIF